MNAHCQTDEVTSPVWNIKLTEKLVRTAFGAAQWDKAGPSVRSTADRPAFCNYHYHEAFDLLSSYIESELKETGLFGIRDEQGEFSYVMLKIRANIVAFIQSLHALADTCSHMLYYSLALDRQPRPLKERDISAEKVIKLLEQRRADGGGDYYEICRLFRDIISGGDYQYLCALANTLKHRNIVRPELNEDFTGQRQEKWILFLESFSHNGTQYEKRIVRDFMQREHDRIQPLTVNIGIELNKVLSNYQSRN